MTADHQPPGSPLRMKLNEYFDFVQTAERKYEYRDGEVVDMSGGTVRHSRIITNTLTEIGNRLKGSQCHVYDSNLRVRIPHRAVYSYPDVSVICGEVQIDPADRTGESVCNPVLMIEVLSPSTEAYDRGKKFERAMTIDTLREYVIVDQSQPHIESRYRQPDGQWVLAFTEGADSIARFRSIEIELPLADVYADVKFPPTTPEEASL